MIKVMFVCLGNICRSTMAESVFTDMVNKKGLSDMFEIASSATGTWEIGNPVDPRTQAKLKEEGIYCVPHKAVQFTDSDYANFDHILVFDSKNMTDILKMTNNDPDGKIRKLLLYSDEYEFEDIADPWYTLDFDSAYLQIKSGCEKLLEKLLN